MKNSKSIYRRFYQELAEHKVAFTLLIILGIIFNTILSVTPLIMAKGIDAIVQLLTSPDKTTQMMSHFTEQLKLPMILLIISVIAIAIFSFLQEYLMAQISERVTLSLRTKVIKKFKKLPFQFYDQHQVGDIMSRTTSDLKRVSDFLLNNINQMISSVVTIFLGISFMIYISPAMTIIALLVIALSLLSTKWISSLNKKYADLNQKNLGSFSNVAEELYAGNLVIKSFNMQEQAIAQFDQQNKTYYDSFKKSQFITFAIYPAIRLLNQLSFVISAIIGAKLVIEGKMTIGTIQAYLQYVNQISEPITTSSYVINASQGAMASMERVFELLDAEEELPELVEAKIINQPQGQIQFNNVKFGYQPDKILMTSVSFAAKEQQMIAIVGATGAGKTTLINLLMRFYEINGGEITFDGQTINTLNKKRYRRMFGMVLQDSWIFDGTIAENIAYGKPNAMMPEIIAAAKAAQCDHFIRTLPNGYNTLVGNGGNSISQGQQQLLTIARVFLTDPNVVILDEATSSVDTRTELAVQHAMKTIMKGRTSFVIAHRLSTITKADMILVMKEGNIIEQGTHTQLLDQKGAYEELYSSQFSH